MKVGVLTACNDESIGPIALARALEGRGFDSLFLPEHSHIPEAETTYPDGTPLAREYYRNMDPFVALAAAAAVTTRLRLGTGVTLLVQRDPIVLAKEVATLDVVSGGRVELGVGTGWNRTEMRNHGTDPRTRITLLSERVQAMKRIWTEERAEFHGTMVDFDPIYSWPKPLQRPYPRVWLGGWGPTTFRRILDHGDGWMAPTGAPTDELARGMEELRRAAAELGRPAPPVIATAFDPSVETMREFEAAAHAPGRRSTGRPHRTADSRSRCVPRPAVPAPRSSAAGAG